MGIPRAGKTRDGGLMQTPRAVEAFLAWVQAFVLQLEDFCVVPDNDPNRVKRLARGAASSLGGHPLRAH
jgi:hypothetical protein